MKDWRIITLAVFAAALIGCDQTRVIDHSQDAKKTFSSADRKAKEGN
jgi:hypothetical protein